MFREMKDLNILDVPADLEWAMLVAYHRGRMETIKGTEFYNRYKAFSDMMKDGTMPIFNMVWFGLGRDEDGVCAYTRGMRQFGKDEMEILGSKQLPSELRDFLINIAGYVLEGDVLLHDGETIGVSNEQRCKITKSPGVFMEGESLKIEW